MAGWERGAQAQVAAQDLSTEQRHVCDTPTAAALWGAGGCRQRIATGLTPPRRRNESDPDAAGGHKSQCSQRAPCASCSKHNDLSVCYPRSLHVHKLSHRDLPAAAVQPGSSGCNIHPWVPQRVRRSPTVMASAAHPVTSSTTQTTARSSLLAVQAAPPNRFDRAIRCAAHLFASRGGGRHRPPLGSGRRRTRVPPPLPHAAPALPPLPIPPPPLFPPSSTQTHQAANASPCERNFFRLCSPGAYKTASMCRSWW